MWRWSTTTEEPSKASVVTWNVIPSRDPQSRMVASSFWRSFALPEALTIVNMNSVNFMNEWGETRELNWELGQEHFAVDLIQSHKRGDSSFAQVSVLVAACHHKPQYEHLHVCRMTVELKDCTESSLNERGRKKMLASERWCASSIPWHRDESLDSCCPRPRKQSSNLVSPSKQ